MDLLTANSPLSSVELSDVESQPPLDCSEVVESLDELALQFSALQKPQCVVRLDQVLFERVDVLEVALDPLLVVVGVLFLDVDLAAAALHVSEAVHGVVEDSLDGKDVISKGISDCLLADIGKVAFDLAHMGG